MSVSKSESLRMMLAQNAGMLLDNPNEKRAKQIEANRAAQPVQLDRGRIRRILIERGAHPDDLRWLTISAPSVEAAENYIPWRRTLESDEEE